MWERTNRVSRLSSSGASHPKCIPVPWNGPPGEKLTGGKWHRGLTAVVAAPLPLDFNLFPFSTHASNPHPLWQPSVCPCVSESFPFCLFMETFRKRQKIMEMKRFHREEISALWCSCTHFWLEGKFQPSLAPCFLPLPLPSFSSFSCFYLSISILFPSHLPVSFIPLVPSPLPVWLSFFHSTSHWSEGWLIWADCIQAVALPPWPTSRQAGALEGAAETCIGHFSYTLCSLLLWTNWAQMTQILKCSMVCVHSQSA